MVEYIYVQPPPDGIYDFDFYAMPPSRPAAEVITKISMHYLMDPMPSGLTGVRIHASNNAKVAMLTSSTSPSIICVKGKLTNEGVECQAFRSTTNELFTLVGNLHGFKNGDEVVVCGAIAEISFCRQGTIINVS